MVFGTSPEINQCKTLGYALSINASIYKGFKIGSAQVWYQVLAISGGEQFDRSKPLLRQAEKRVGFKVQSDIQDIETTYSVGFGLFVQPGSKRSPIFKT